MLQLLAVPHPRYWREWELDFLRRHYSSNPTEPIAAALRRPLKRVLAKANALGLRKSRELIAAIAAERSARPGHGGKAHQFKPGLVPWNKGTKGLVGVQPECRATQFKPGSRPHTWVPVGSFRVSADGVLELKVHDEPGAHNQAKRWRNFSQVVWERDVGPIPPGHIVVFRAGLRTTEPALVTADRLECISRAENVRRNSVHKLAPELRELVHIRSRLTRAINTKARQGKEHHAP
jgi:hypothetical protein